MFKIFVVALNEELLLNFMGIENVNQEVVLSISIVVYRVNDSAIKHILMTYLT